MITQAKREKIRSMYADGHTLKSIAKKVKTSPSTVYHHVKRIKLEGTATDKTEVTANIKSLVDVTWDDVLHAQKALAQAYENYGKAVAYEREKSGQSH